ncbi:MAG: hypothetical protein H8E28_09350, partial [Anaerolineae bacterium]|nr:hypothetical protein [Anaerolineae bacterium]
MLRDFGPGLVSYLSPMIWLQGNIATKVDLLLQSGVGWGATLDNFFPYSLLVGSMLWLGAFSFLLVWHGAAHLARKYGHTIYYIIVTLLLSLFLAELSAFYFRIDSGYPTFVIISFLLILLLAALLYKRASELRERYSWLVIPAGFITFFMLLQGVISAQVKTLSDPLGNALAPVAMALRRYWAGINDALAFSPQLTLGGEFRAFLPYALLWGFLAWMLAFCAVLTIQGMRKDLLTGLLRRWRWMAGFFVLLMALSIPAYLQFSLAPTPEPELVELPALPDLHKAQPQDLIEFDGALWGAYSDGVYRFDDDDEAWAKVSAGLPDIIGGGTFHIYGNALWFGTGNKYLVPGDGGVFQFNENKNAWEAQRDNLPDAITSVEFIEFDGDLWAHIWSAVDGGIYKYSEYAETWLAYIDGFPTDRESEAMTVYDGKFWFGTYFLDQENDIWIEMSTGLPGPFFSTASAVYRQQMFLSIRSFTETGGGVYRFNPDLMEWQNLNIGLDSSDAAIVDEFVVSKSDVLWARTLGKDIYWFNTTTETWENNNISKVTDIYETKQESLWLDAGATVYYLADVWENHSVGMPSGMVFYERKDGELWNGHYRLRSGTDIWKPFDDGLPVRITVPNLIQYNNGLWLNIYAEGMYHRAPDENTWNAVTTGLPAVSRINDVVVAGNNHLWVLADGASYRYNSELEIWESLSSGLSFGEQFIVQTNDTLWTWAQSLGILHRFNPETKSWVSYSEGLPQNIGTRELIYTATDEFWMIASGLKNIYRFDEIVGWQLMNEGLPEDFTMLANILEIVPEEIWLLVSDEGAYRFEREKQAWQPMNDGVSAGTRITRLHNTADNLLWGSDFFGTIYYFDALTELWQPTSLPQTINLSGMLAFEGKFYVSASNDIYRYDLVADRVEQFASGLPQSISYARFFELDNTLWLGSNYGIYRLDLDKEIWLPENNFVDLPVCVARDEEGMLVVD